MNLKIIPPAVRTDAAQIFSFQSHSVRVLGTPDKPWFVAKDVCDVLEIENHRDTLAKALEDDEKGVDTIYTLGGQQKMLTVNESGLYSLIFRSRKPEARQFRRWVTNEVLPAIRKTGGFRSSRPVPASPSAGNDPLLLVAGTIEVFMSDKAQWIGTATDLWQGTYDSVLDSEKAFWPSNPVWLGRRLRQAQTILASYGVGFHFLRSGASGRMMVLTRIKPVPRTLPSPAASAKLLPAKSDNNASLSQIIVEQALEIQHLKSLLSKQSLTGCSLK